LSENEDGEDEDEEENKADEDQEDTDRNVFGAFDDISLGALDHEVDAAAATAAGISSPPPSIAPDMADVAAAVAAVIPSPPPSTAADAADAAAAVAAVIPSPSPFPSTAPTITEDEEEARLRLKGASTRRGSRSWWCSQRSSKSSRSLPLKAVEVSTRQQTHIKSSSQPSAGARVINRSFVRATTSQFSVWTDGRRFLSCLVLSWLVPVVPCSQRSESAVSRSHTSTSYVSMDGQACVLCDEGGCADIEINTDDHDNEGVGEDRR